MFLNFVMVSIVGTHFNYSSQRFILVQYPAKRGAASTNTVLTKPLFGPMLFVVYLNYLFTLSTREIKHEINYRFRRLLNT